MTLTILCIAGFGDNGSMFEPLLDTELAQRVNLVPLNLPGFGAPRMLERTSLTSLANVLNNYAIEQGADTVMAHSVASIIASLAAQQVGSPIKHILSLEGNLTPEDAYFSGSAADYKSEESFFAAFIEKLSKLSVNDLIMERYLQQVESADPLALWQLGCDARQYSDSFDPGQSLVDSAQVNYFYNSDNLPKASLNWLENNSSLTCTELHGASHWPTIDQPIQLSEAVIAALDL